MKTSLNAKKRPITVKTRYWPVQEQEKRARDVEIFGRSVLEMIRQRPGISEAELRSMYTRREQPIVDDALSQLKSGGRVEVKDDNGALRLYLNRPAPPGLRESGPEGYTYRFSPAPRS